MADGSTLAFTRGNAARIRARAHRILLMVERHPALSIFVIAVIARIVGALVVHVLFGQQLVLDDDTYSFMASAKASGQTESWDAFTHDLYANTATFMIPLTALYKLFGAEPAIGQFYVILLGAGAATATTLVAKQMVGTRWALIAGMIVALLPSQILFSSLILKDASVWLVLASLGLAVASANKAKGWHLAAIGAAVTILLWLLGHLRLHTLVVASIAMMIGCGFGQKEQRWPRILGAAVIGVSVPWLLGIGPGGLTLVMNAGSLEERRVANAQGANSAIVQVDPDPAGSLSEIEQDVVSLRAEMTVEETAQELNIPPAEVREIEESIPDSARSVPEVDRPITGFLDEESLDPDLAHLPRGISVMLVEPLPWQTGETIAFRLAQLETIVWYPLLLLAALGLLSAFRNPRVMMFPLLVGGGVLLMYALTEGNIGTAYRHRGEFVWVIALLAMLGLQRVVTRRHSPSYRRR